MTSLTMPLFGHPSDGMKMAAIPFGITVQIGTANLGKLKGKMPANMSIAAGRG